MGRARATHINELPGHALSEHGGDPQHDDVGSADSTSNPSHVRDAPGAGRGTTDCERVCCNERHYIRGTTMMARSSGENTRRESWYGSRISLWDETGE